MGTYVPIMNGGYNPRRQGDKGEMSAMEWLDSKGYDVFVPLGHSPDIDLIAARGSELLRIQVKTTICFRNQRWTVMIATRGGNQSWTGIVKYFSADRCDYLFVLVGDGRRWFIPAPAVEARSGLVLGGPKYAQFEVEPGRPLPIRLAA
jgi:Holliday junction resolvase-like predicted endonuclease